MERLFKKSTLFLLMLFLLCSAMTAACFAVPLVTVGKAEISDERATVPIGLSGNTGICGATLSVSYDSELQLVEITQGSALTSLTMTKPGNLFANPINLGWDGVEQDTTDGVIAYLTFVLPSRSGSFGIQLSYNEGDIVDGDLNSVTVQTKDGSVVVSSENPNPDEPIVPDEPIDPSETTLFLDSIIVKPGEQFRMPVQLSGNRGICGATIHIDYNAALVLTNVEKGAALPSLAMTKPGKFTTSPVNIGWDGVEQDNTNGTVAFLCFTAPRETGIYTVEISYDDGDIVDGDLQPVAVKTVSGKVVVQDKEVESVNVEIGYSRTVLQGNPREASYLYVAFYAASGKMLSVKRYDIGNESIAVSAEAAASMARIMWLDEHIRPICEAKTIYLI